jgi:curli production assembly/transport component CsgG
MRDRKTPAATMARCPRCAAALLAFPLALLGAGCNILQPAPVDSPAALTPVSKGYRDLTRLPPPKGKIPVAVYGFRDQTGQYKPSPDSSFSTAVTQGAASILTKALKDSGWFTPVEREGLQNLLTERRVIRAIENPQDKGNPAIQLPPLMPANVVIEGGVIAYENNVRTGGVGVRYLGVGISEQYRVDQVSINLRAVDVRTGQVLSSVSTTKTVYSRQLNTGVYTYVSFKELLEAEVGYSRNEPPQLAVKEAVEAAVIHLIVQGVRDKLWVLEDEKQIDSPIVQAYLREAEDLVAGIPGDPGRKETRKP